MLALFPLLILPGFLLPGCLIARRLGHPLWWATGFVYSLLILFHSAFWLGMFHVRITLGSVLPVLLAATAAAGWWARSSLKPVKSGTREKWDLQDRLLLLVCAASTVALLYRAATSPMLGFDTLFRWDFLAQRILALGNFDFYPPLTPADFRTYFYVDGIPPLVSFSNWWIYAAAGGRYPALVSVFAAAQFAGTLAFVYGAASALFSRKAGLLAAAMLAACPLFFNAVVIEQETGLTALSIAAMVYFLVRAQPGDTAGLVSAGLAAALCALSREYGWIALIGGAGALLWRGFPGKQIALFGAVAAAAAGPWYVREWLRTGNPFYSLSVGPFPVNPIHDGILQFYRTVVKPDDGLIALLVTLAPLQLLAGIPGAVSRLRERGYLALMAALVAAAWLQSIGYTSAGLEVSLRVLTPAMAVLSVTAGGLLVRWRTAAVGAAIVCMLWTIAQGSVYPGPFSQWPEKAFQPGGEPAEFQIAAQLESALPKGTRILTDNAYLHAALANRGVDVTPVWSPEVRFLFGSSADEADRKLRELGLDTIAYYPSSMNTAYLAGASQFYSALPKRWRKVADVSDVLVFYKP